MSGETLLSEGVLSSKDELQIIRRYADTFDDAVENNRVYSQDPRINILMKRALTSYQRDDSEEIGRVLGKVASLLYKDEHPAMY